MELREVVDLRERMLGRRGRLGNEERYSTIELRRLRLGVGEDMFRAEETMNYLLGGTPGLRGLAGGINRAEKCTPGVWVKDV